MFSIISRVKSVKNLILSKLDQLLSNDTALLQTSQQILTLLQQQALEKSHGKNPIYLEYPINPSSRYGYGKPPHPQLLEIINQNRETYKAILQSIAKYHVNFQRIAITSAPNDIEPIWNTTWLPAYDAAALYSFLCLNNPERYIEVGSGTSTKFARKAITDHNLRTKVISIDPFPRTEIDSICDQIIRKKLEEVDLELFDELQAGDILFIDNSHCVFMNSDSTVVFLDILPRLKPGVLVEFHDIFLPYDYPPEWIDRYYSEQYLLAAYLLAQGKKFDILLPNCFVSGDTELRDIISFIWDKPEMEAVVKGGGSFWIKMN
jgi:hypothetical protein